MKRLLVAMLGLVATVAGATPRAGQRAVDEAAIVAGERAWGQAYVHGDVAVVRDLLDDDFRGVDPRGNIYDKAAVLADVAALPHASADAVDPVAVRFFGDMAVAQAREHEVGPPPELHPAERVFTDVWVRRAGRWRIVAAEDLDPGLPTAPAHQGDVAVIRALRLANNAAILHHDMAAFLPAFADDAVFTWSNGSSAVGKPALEAFFAHDFADPAFIAYVRTPQSISVSSTGARAAEHGVWTALKQGTRYGGDYLAHWARTSDGWRVRGEVYVKLYCSGALCTP
ncbi:MAG: hypothetical protein JWR80_7257 [Bradyrhizobium sp.]|nr:hypothetical protein [Bradyrhizobium sp.]